MKYQILKYNPAPEAFYFVRDDEYTRGVRLIKQWDTLDEAKTAVRAMLDYERQDIEHVIVTVHVGFKHTTTYPEPKPIHNISEFDLDTINERARAVDAVGQSPENPT